MKDWLVNLEKRPVRASVDRFPAYQEALLDQDIVVVSDRFHLVDNLWRCLNSICQRILPSRIPVNLEGDVSYGLKPEHPTEPEKETKRPLVERVRSMHRQGMSLNAIAQMLSLNWRTVKKYSDPAYEPSPQKRQRPHLIDRFMITAIRMYQSCNLIYQRVTNNLPSDAKAPTNLHIASL